MKASGEVAETLTLEMRPSLSRRAVSAAVAAALALAEPWISMHCFCRRTNTSVEKVEETGDEINNVHSTIGAPRSVGYTNPKHMEGKPKHKQP